MKSIIILAIALFLASVFFLIGSVVMADTRPMGIAVGLLFSSLVLGIRGVQKRKSNALLIIGNVLVFLSCVALFATINMLPDYRPLITSAVLLLIGLSLFGMGWRGTTSKGSANGVPLIGVVGSITAIILLGIAAVLYPQISWNQPGNPAAVMILSTLTGLGVLLALIFNHRRKNLIVGAGLIFILNFLLIRVYESGSFDFIGAFLRRIEPLYASFDPWALTVEYSLILFTIALSFLLIVKNKAKVSNYGSITLIYLIITPIFATLLFEMLGLVAGESTTRAELLATNTMAVMETIGIVFIAVFFYILFQFLPFWIPPLLAGFWWLLWKVWMLHHPPPETFMANFVEHAPFLFLSAIKRIALPMVIIIMFVQVFSRQKPE